MKLIPLFSMLCICCSLCSTAQTSSSQGITFFKGSWKEVLAEAKKQQKLIFVDVYTDWCGPCKQMDSEIFPKQQVGEVYNRLFISYRLNAEKGEGINLASQYAVKSYPCYLFLDASGNVIDRDGDYQSADAFLALGKRASTKKNAAGNLDELRKSYEKGDRKPDFLKAYLVKRTSLSLDNSEILNDYVSVLPIQSFDVPEEILFLSRNMGSTFSNAVPLLISRLHLLDSAQKREVTDRLYSKLLYYSFATALKEKRFEDAGKRLDEIETILPFISDQHLASINNLKLRYFSDIKDGVRLKSLGYSLAARQMAIPADTIVKKDLELFHQVMKPFLSGEKDSLKVIGFQEDKKLAARQCSQGIASLLYTISTSFLSALEPGDKGLNDALTWATYTYTLAPNQNTKALCDKLRDRLKKNGAPIDE